MIDVSHLSFEYEGKEVLHNISFSIAPNSVVALVGPNGAGKTTLMRCLAALEMPVAGSVYMNGIDTSSNPRQVHRYTGYLSDFFGLYERLTVEQCLDHMAGCQNIARKERKQRVAEVAKETGLAGHMDRPSGKLSRGYRQRLGVGMAIIHKPKILILDEPASGMDPEARVKLSELILNLKSQGMTIMVSSHILAELEDYCTDMLVIRDGRLLDHVIQKNYKKSRIRSVFIECTDMDDRYIEFVKTQDYVSEVKPTKRGFCLSYTAGEDQLSELLKTMLNTGIPVFSFETRKKTLQKVYMDLAETQEKEGQTQ